MRLLLALMCLATPVLAQPAIFPFTHYQSEDTFNIAANHAFPTGSSLQSFQQVMSASGAVPTANRATPNLVYAYRQPVGILSANQWTITVAAKDDNIRSISTHFGVISTQQK